jgi:hypothetical protein
MCHHILASSYILVLSYILASSYILVLSYILVSAYILCIFIHPYIIMGLTYHTRLSLIS